MENHVEKCLGGDNQACAGLVEECSSPIRETIGRILRKYTNRADQDDIDDFFGEFYIHVSTDNWRRLRGFKGNASILTYLKVIAVNQVLDALRRRREHLSIDDDDIQHALRAPSPTPERWLELTEARKILKECLHGLKPREQLLLKLSFYRELPPREISSILRISAKAVSDRKGRAVEKLRSCAEKHGLKRLNW